jgi:hypothetical protein
MAHSLEMMNSLERISNKEGSKALLECQVCCDTLNKSSNKPVVCPYSDCKYSACVSCVRTYLLENPQSSPHCMSCKKPLNNLFLVQCLGSSWTNKTYLPHISLILTEMEIARLSESMEEAEKIKKINEITLQLNNLYRDRTNLLIHINKLKIELDNSTNSNDIRVDIIKKIRHEKGELKDIRLEITNRRSQIRILNKEEEKEKKVFTMPCSYNECKGMLSTQYKCGLCDKYTCKDCGEPLQEEHKCNPDNVATKKVIIKDTRPCPKCNTRIFKIEGCDQMWCTSCKTPFSWSTGKIVPNGQRLHNPHAIEYLRQTGITVRAPDDLVCGGVISFIQLHDLCDNIDRTIYVFVENVFVKYNYNYTQSFVDNCKFKSPPDVDLDYSFAFIIQFLKVKLCIAYNIINNVSRNQLRVAREESQSNLDFNHERVQFILNKMDKNKFAKNIKSSYKRKNSQKDLSYIWELVSTFGIEMFKTLYEESKYPSGTKAFYFLNLVIQKLSEFSALVKYSNLQLATVSVAHSINVYVIVFRFDLCFPSFRSKHDIDEFIRKEQLNKSHRNITFTSDLFKSEKFTQIALKKMTMD